MTYQEITPVTNETLAQRGLRIQQALQAQKEQEKAKEEQIKQVRLNTQLAVFVQEFEGEFVSEPQTLTDLHPHYMIEKGIYSEGPCSLPK